MPKIIQTEVFTFNELSPKAKEKAREWFRKCSEGDNHFAEYVYEDSITIGKLFGLEIGHTTRNWTNISTGKTGTQQTVNIFWSGFWSQGDGASFTGTYRYTPGALEAVKAYAPKDEKLQAIAARLEANGIPGMGFNITTHGNYSHSASMRFELFAYDNEDQDISESVTAEQEKESVNALRAFADWIYRQLETEYEYQNSDESINESMDANEYTFDVTGQRFG